MFLTVPVLYKFNILEGFVESLAEAGAWEVADLWSWVRLSTEPEGCCISRHYALRWFVYELL